MRRGRMLRARGGVDSSAAARAGGSGGDRLPALLAAFLLCLRTRGQGDLHHSPSGSFGLPSQSLTRPRGRLRIKQCLGEGGEGGSGPHKQSKPDDLAVVRSRNDEQTPA